ncbi:MAG: cell division protein FtsZ [Syntrophothermus sp.]
MLKFDLPKNQSSIIKVIGVGGGGSNAVTHMFRQGIKGVDFIICNTDAQAMEASPVPTKIQLGANLTGGLGAGAVPTIGKNAALENVEDIRAILEKGTKMLFITAGMGGGTGTGAAPVIASVAREMGILTVGIVTLPFSFEGRKRNLHAEQGISEMKRNVDALLIICNDKLRDLFGDQRLSAAFGHADDVLTTAAKGIAEIITVTGYINVDFEDVKTVMKNSGVAIMGSGMASGANRAHEAIEMALNSPLLNDNNIEGAVNLLLYIASGKDEITMDEVSTITDYIQEMTKNSAEVIWGNGIDESLDDKISVTLIATGFDDEHKKKPEPAEKVKKMINLYENEPVARPYIPTPAEPPVERITDIQVAAIMPEPLPEPEPEPIHEPEPELQPDYFMMQEPAEPEPVYNESKTERTIIFEFEEEKEENTSSYIPSQPVAEEPAPPVREIEIPVQEIMFRKSYQPPVQKQEPVASPDVFETRVNDRILRLKAMSEKLKSHPPLADNLTEIENIPAYKRRNVELSEVQLSSSSQVPLYSVGDNAEIRTENTFLHNNVD